MTIALLLGVLVGLVMGLTGAGGGILGVPVLVVGMGWTMQQAAPVALVAVVAAAVLGAIEGFRHKLVRYRAALLMAAAGIPLTWLGIRLAHSFSQQCLQGLFALVMLLVAARLFRRELPLTEARAERALARLGRIHPETGRFIWSWPTALLMGSIGGATGFMTGLLGVGGGFFMVPLLRRFTNVSLHGVIATTLLVVALVGSASIVTALAHGATLPWQATTGFALATAMGMLLGRRLAQRLSERYIQYGFASLLIAVALGLLISAIRA